NRRDTRGLQIDRCRDGRTGGSGGDRSYAETGGLREGLIDMIRIDGSVGEGGGQILRTALSLSLATGTPFQIENIRAGRKKAGLLRQHLTAVLAAAEIGQADVEGAALGSPALAF